MYGYIYETTNLINGKKYIGQKKSEKFLAEKYLGSGKILNKAIDKYGKENFKVKLIEECKTEEELNEREIYWIKYYKNNYKDKCYNICDGGHFRFYNTGHKLSKEHKEKIGNANRGRHHTFETKMYLSKVLKGRKLSEETKKKMSIFQKNRPKDNRGDTISKVLKGHLVSEETKKKISKSQRKRFNNPEIRKKYSEASKKMMTKEVREKISKSQTGRKLSIETRKKMSKNRKGKIAINNGIHNKYINKNDLALYLKEGYIKGGLSRKKGDRGVKIR